MRCLIQKSIQTPKGQQNEYSYTCDARIYEEPEGAGAFTLIHVAVPGKLGQIPTVLQRRASGNACRVAGLSFDATPQWHREPERCIS